VALGVELVEADLAAGGERFERKRDEAELRNSFRARRVACLLHKIQQ
jgi:hypothetical protein